jgi:hypothetical protein
MHGGLDAHAAWWRRMNDRPARLVPGTKVTRHSPRHYPISLQAASEYPSINSIYTLVSAWRAQSCTTKTKMRPAAS